MLRLSKMIGFVLTKDTKQARRFYEGTLGFTFVAEDPFALVLKAGENQIRISPVPELAPAQHTVLGWEVSQIERRVDELTERGVTFERYPWMKHDPQGIWTAPGGDRVAWFKDPDGNVLSISEHFLR